MTIGTLAELKDMSIMVTESTVAVWPQYGNEERPALPANLDQEPLYTRYCIDKGTMAFVDESGFYVTPYTAKAEGVLGYNHFRYMSFYVPFSNRDYPRDEYARWEDLRERARES